MMKKSDRGIAVIAVGVMISGRTETERKAIVSVFLKSYPVTVFFIRKFYSKNIKFGAKDCLILKNTRVKLKF